MSNLHQPWLCPVCKSSWFYKREVRQYEKVNCDKYNEPTPYLAPGEMMSRNQYICSGCGRELVEILQ